MDLARIPMMLMQMPWNIRQIFLAQHPEYLPIYNEIAMTGLLAPRPVPMPVPIPRPAPVAPMPAPVIPGRQQGLLVPPWLQPGNRGRPIVVFDSDYSDDDVIPLSRPPTPPPPVETPQMKIKVRRQLVQIPDVPVEIRQTYKEALRLAPNLDRSRVCILLEQVVRSNKPVDNLLDRIIIAGTDPQVQPFYAIVDEQEAFLMALFPNRYMADIRASSSAGLPEAVRRLSVNTGRAMKNPRKSPVLLKIRAIPVAIDILEIYEEDQKRKAEEKKQEDYENAKRLNQLIECECCYNECLFEDMAQCGGGHLFCKDCLKTSIETVVSEGRANLKCLSTADCDACIPVSELERCVPERTVKRLFATETENAVLQTDVEGLVRCHHCGYRVIVDGSGIFRCPECVSDTCTGCGRAGHAGMSCEAFAGIDKDRIVEEKMNEAVIRVCPKCSAQFMKEEGCNKMECPRCSTWICYWCRKEIPKEVGYSHFWRNQGACPPDRCPLWVSNDTLHRIEAVHAGERMKENLRDL